MVTISAGAGATLQGQVMVDGVQAGPFSVVSTTGTGFVHDRRSPVQANLPPARIPWRCRLRTSPASARWILLVPTAPTSSRRHTRRSMARMQPLDSRARREAENISLMTGSTTTVDSMTVVSSVMDCSDF